MMKINLKRIDDDFLFELSNSNNQKILLNNTSRDSSKGVSPMEALLMSLAGCTGIDMVAILKKQRQNLKDFRVEVNGDRKEVLQAKPFDKIQLKFLLEGEIDPDKARRAAELSFEKYCSVSMSLHPDIKITWEISINGEMISLD